MHTMRFLRTVAGYSLAMLLAQPVMAAPFAYIGNSHSDTISIVDVASNVVVATVNVGHGPSGVAASVPGTSVYVLNTLDNTVSVINATTRLVTAVIPVGQSGSYASGLAIDR